MACLQLLTALGCCGSSSATCSKTRHLCPTFWGSHARPVNTIFPSGGGIQVRFHNSARGNSKNWETRCCHYEPAVVTRKRTWESLQEDAAETQGPNSLILKLLGRIKEQKYKNITLTFARRVQLCLMHLEKEGSLQAFHMVEGLWMRPGWRLTRTHAHLENCEMYG